MRLDRVNIRWIWFIVSAAKHTPRSTQARLNFHALKFGMNFALLTIIAIRYVRCVIPTRRVRSECGLFSLQCNRLKIYQKYSTLPATS